MFILSLVFGMFAIMFWLFSVQKKEKKDILSFQLIANILYAMQYIFLGAFSAASMNITSALRCGTFYMYESKKEEIPRYLLIIFILIILICGFLTYNGFLSLIPIIITIFYTYSAWKKNTNWIRYVFIFAALVWIYYNLSTGAYISVVGNILEIISGVISLVRFKK